MDKTNKRTAEQKHNISIGKQKSLVVRQVGQVAWVQTPALPVNNRIVPGILLSLCAIFSFKYRNNKSISK